MGTARSAIRGSFFDFVDDPWKHPGDEQKSARFIPDGLMVLEDGIIKDFGPFETLSAKHPHEQVTHIQNRLILPGFIDGHIHLAQTRVLGSYGEQLLPWLQKWIFPEEKKYSDLEYARKGCEHFFNNILAAGTTTCQAFTTHDATVADAFFTAATTRNMRVISGVTGIDMFAPEGSTDTPENFYNDSKKLLNKWHKNGRNLYAITPRFALGCSAEMMTACQRLRKEHPDVYVTLTYRKTRQKFVCAWRITVRKTILKHMKSTTWLVLVSLVDTEFGFPTTKCDAFQLPAQRFRFVRHQIFFWVTDSFDWARQRIPTNQSCSISAQT